MECLVEKRNGNLIFRLYNDETPDDPRTWDNLWHIVCTHNRYVNGDEQAGDLRTWVEYWQQEHPHGLIHPVYAYIHGGVVLSTGEFDDRWDSGQIGVAVYDPASEPSPDPLACLRDELDTYTKYLNGEVYGYRVVEVEKCDKCGHEEENEVDSCWGFYSQADAEESAGWKDAETAPTATPE